MPTLIIIFFVVVGTSPSFKAMATSISVHPYLPMRCACSSAETTSSELHLTRNASAWSVQFLSEEEGNSQQKTGDNHEHLQGFTHKRLFETYQKWHADPENNVGGTLGKMCSRTTFHRQCDPNRTCNPIDNPNHGSAPKSTLTFSITLKVVIIRKSSTNENAEHQT